MASHTTPPPNLDLASDGWEDLERLLADLRRLTREPLSPDEFYSRLLERLVSELGARGGVVWQVVRPGSVQAVCQIHPQAAELVDSIASQRFHLATVEAVAASGQTLTVLPQSSSRGRVNPTRQTLIFSPVLSGLSGGHVLELVLDNGDPSALAGVVSFLEAAASLAAEFHRQMTTRRLAEQVSAADAIEAFALRVHGRLDLEAVALAVVNEALPLLASERNSLLLVEGKRCRLLAVSGLAGFDRRSGSVRELEKLAAAVAATDELRHPGDEELPPQLEAALQAYVDESHASQLVARPLVRDAGDNEEQPPLAVLVVEYFHPVAEPAPPAVLDAIARHSAVAIDNALLCQRWTWFRLISRYWGEEPLRRRKTRRWTGIVAVLLVLLVIVGLWPVNFYVAAPGKLEPANRRDVFAPASGVVRRLLVEEGRAVAAEEPLLELHSPALELQISEVLGKRQASEAALAAARALRLTESGAGSRGEDSRRYVVQEEELQATLAGLQEQYQLLQTQRERLLVRSPMAGEVVSRDLARRLPARPVSSGELLMRVADTQGPWQVLLELPQYRLAQVLEARQRGAAVPVEFIVSATPSRSYQARLESVGQAVQLNAEGQAYVPLVGHVEELPAGHARPGAAIQAQILCGRRSLAYVWLHDVWEAIALRWWH